MDDVINDPILGRMEWHPDILTWSGHIDLAPALRVGVTFVCEGMASKELLAAARRGVEWLRGNEVAARRRAATAMLPEYDGVWRTVFGPVTEEELAARLTIRDVTFEPDGSFALWYRDDGLFGGHPVVADFDTTGQFRQASVVGECDS